LSEQSLQVEVEDYGEMIAFEEETDDIFVNLQNLKAVDKTLLFFDLNLVNLASLRVRLRSEA
jgi:hypothetical protein